MKRQVVILDLVRRPFSEASIEFVKKKVASGIEKELKALNNSEGEI